MGSPVLTEVLFHGFDVVLERRIVWRNDIHMNAALSCAPSRHGTVAGGGVTIENVASITEYVQQAFYFPDAGKGEQIDFSINDHSRLGFETI
jgi:hypothetical protein